MRRIKEFYHPEMDTMVSMNQKRKYIKIIYALQINRLAQVFSSLEVTLNISLLFIVKSDAEEKECTVQHVLKR